MNGIAMRRSWIVALVACLAAGQAHAGDRAQPSVVAHKAEYDPATQMHAYHYVVSSPAGNTAPIDTFVVLLEPGVDVVTGFRSPPGWRAFYSAEQGRVMWGATGYLQPDTEDADGNVAASDFAIAPGTSLAGFSFRSFGPPGAGVAITQSYAPLHSPESEEEFEHLEASREHSTLPDDNGYRLSALVPVPDSDWRGNRRPAVDGFLVFANLQDRATFRGSVMIVLRLGTAGELVDASTLRVLLNGSDVTAAFQWNDEYRGLAATFPGGPPLRIGSNVLRTSVEGVVPGTTDRRATDTDRVTFDFQPSP